MAAKSAILSQWVEFCCGSRILCRLRGISPAKLSPMHSAGGSTTSTPVPSSDIVFACSHCATSFVVDAAAAGVTLQCQNCGKPTTVPKANVEAPVDDAVRLSDLQHQ